MADIVFHVEQEIEAVVRHYVGTGADSTALQDQQVFWLFAISLALHACFPKNSFCAFGASNANSWEIHNHNNKTQAVVQGIYYFLIQYFDCSLSQCPKKLILA